MCSLILCKMEQKDPTNHLRRRLAFIYFRLMYKVKRLLTICLLIHNKHVKAEILVSDSELVWLYGYNVARIRNIFVQTQWR